MTYCATCDKMKTDWKKEKMGGAVSEARRLFVETGNTQAVIKRAGCIYEVIPASEVKSDTNVIQYISSATTN